MKFYYSLTFTVYGNVLLTLYVVSMSKHGVLPGYPIKLTHVIHTLYYDAGYAASGVTQGVCKCTCIHCTHFVLCIRIIVIIRYYMPRMAVPYITLFSFFYVLP